MRTWKDVATLVRTKNLKGRFVARPAAGLPIVLEEGLEVALVPPQTDLPRHGIVDYMSELGDGSFEVGLDTVADEATAHGLVGCHCLVRRADVEDLLDESLPASWAGWTVLRLDGSSIGEVLDLVENPGQLLLEVERGATLPAAYIPVVDEFVVKVDEVARSITVDVPEALLTLND